MQPVLFEPPANIQVPDPFGRVTFRTIDSRQILTKPTGSLQRFDYSLNPYIGCGFGCAYCYAAFFQADKQRFDEWGAWVEVKQNAVHALRQKDTKGKRIIMGSATDPYQPLEGKLGLTRELLQVFADPLRRPRLSILTRGPLVTRDIDLLLEIGVEQVSMSITTDSEDVRKRFEPACASIDQRLAAVRRLNEAGVTAHVSIMPMLPIRDPKEFAKRIMDTGAPKAYCCYFHKTDREAFAANTRPGAWEIAAEMGWDYDEFQRTAAKLREYLPILKI